MNGTSSTDRWTSENELVEGPARRRCLVIDDEVDTGTILTFHLNRLGYETTVVDTAERGRLALADAAWDLVIIDVILPDLDGRELLPSVRALESRPEVILTSVLSPEELYNHRADALLPNLSVGSTSAPLCAPHKTPPELADATPGPGGPGPGLGPGRSAVRSVPSPVAPRRPSVLFVGDDASSPQIAASLLRRLTGGRVTVATAGTQPPDPGGRSDELLVAMGLDPAAEQPLSARILRSTDRVVVLGTTLDVARVAGTRYEEWDVINDDLLDRVQALSDDLVGDPTRPHRSGKTGSEQPRSLRTLLETAWGRRTSRRGDVHR